jgi:NAD(P)-dependent dehydrogenase (short-subunit alcohol dehydrogenase family)
MAIDKVIFVIGMGPGISAAVARRFGREGFVVGAVARSADKLAQQVAALRESGVKAAGAAADAGDIGSLRGALARLQAELGDPDVLVYNAAGVSHGPLAQVGAEQFAADLAVSVVGAFAAAQQVLPAMRARRSGSILLTGGGFAFEPTPVLASLGVGKAAIRNLAFSLHADLLDIGVHAATVTICGAVTPGSPFDPDRIAEAFWQLHAQPAGGFEREVLIRG